MANEQNALELDKLYFLQRKYGRKTDSILIYKPTALDFQRRNSTYNAPAYSGAAPKSDWPWTEYYKYDVVFSYEKHGEKRKGSETMRNQKSIEESVLAEKVPDKVFDVIFTFA